MTGDGKSTTEIVTDDLISLLRFWQSLGVDELGLMAHEDGAVQARMRCRDLSQFYALTSTLVQHGAELYEFPHEQQCAGYRWHSAIVRVGQVAIRLTSPHECIEAATADDRPIALLPETVQ